MAKGKMYGNKELTGDSACPGCRAQGKDATGNHLQHWKNHDNGEEWAKCNRCGHYEAINEGNREGYEAARNVVSVKSPEEIAAALAEVAELPIKEIKVRSVSHAVAERFGVRVGLSYTDGETPVSVYTPKTVDGELVGYKVRNLEHKSFYAVGKGSQTDLFGIEQARHGDVFTKYLYVFEDELSTLSGFQALSTLGVKNSPYKPACVGLPDGAGSAATAILRNREFVEPFETIVVCMDNDKAGEDAFQAIRALYPDKVLKARIPKGYFGENNEKAIKDANDMMMAGRGLELYNALRWNASKESPAGAATVADCLDDALIKPEWGMSYPWPGLTDLTFGLRYGDLIAVGGGVGG